MLYDPDAKTRNWVRFEGLSGDAVRAIVAFTALLFFFLGVATLALVRPMIERMNERERQIEQEYARKKAAAGAETQSQRALEAPEAPVAPAAQ